MVCDLFLNIRVKFYLFFKYMKLYFYVKYI